MAPKKGIRSHSKHQGTTKNSSVNSVRLILASDYLAGGNRIRAKIHLKMAQIKSWTVSDAWWNKIEPPLPARKRPRGRKYRR